MERTWYKNEIPVASFRGFNGVIREEEIEKNCNRSWARISYPFQFHSVWKLCMRYRTTSPLLIGMQPKSSGFFLAWLNEWTRKVIKVVEYVSTSPYPLVIDSRGEQSRDSGLFDNCPDTCSSKLIKAQRYSSNKLFRISHITLFS